MHSADGTHSSSPASTTSKPSVRDITATAMRQSFASPHFARPARICPTVAELSFELVTFTVLLSTPTGEVR